MIWLLTNSRHHFLPNSPLLSYPSHNRLLDEHQTNTLFISKVQNALPQVFIWFTPSFPYSNIVVSVKPPTKLYKIATKITPPWNPIFMTLHYFSSQCVSLCNILISHLFIYLLSSSPTVYQFTPILFILYLQCIDQCLVHVISKNISQKEKGGELRIKYFISSLVCLAPEEKCTLEVRIHFWLNLSKIFLPCVLQRESESIVTVLIKPQDFSPQNIYNSLSLEGKRNLSGLLSSLLILHSTSHPMKRALKVTSLDYLIGQ